MQCSFYCFHRILNIKFDRKVTLKVIVFSMLIPLIICITKIYYNELYFAIFTILFVLINLLSYRDKINLTVVSSIISCGLSYFFFLISTVLIIPLEVLLVLIDIDNNMVYGGSLIIAGLIEIILCRGFFNFKRLQKGMPFLKEKSSSNTGFMISVLILFLALGCSIMGKKDFLLCIIALLVILCGFILIIWWLKRISKSYISQLKVNEIKSFKNEIALLTNENKSLKQSNNNFVDIIKKDNDIIHIMEVTVKSIDSKDINSEINDLLTQLEHLKTI